MPVVDPKPRDVEPKVEATGRALPMEQKSALVETRVVPHQSLITQVEGAPLIATYFRRLAEENDQLVGQQMDRDSPYQQYEMIRHLEVKLQGEFSYTQDEETKNITITGEAIVYPGVIPNTGDMLLADAGDQVTMVFQVTSSYRMQRFKQSPHRITFSSIGPLTDERRADFERKTQIRSHFVKDFMVFGKNPVILDDNYSAYRSLKVLYRAMVSEYMRTFFSEVCQTFLVPDQGDNVYDPFLAKAVLDMLETEMHPLVRKIDRLNVDVEYAYGTTTVWDTLLMMDPSHLHVAAHRMKLVEKNVVYNIAAMAGAFWTEVNRLVYPIDRRTDADRFTNPSARTIDSKIKRSAAPIDDFQRLMDDTNVDAVELVDEKEPVNRSVWIHRIAEGNHNDDYYVFSKAFYKRDVGGMSELEKMVWSVLDDNDIDAIKLEHMVRDSQNWDNLERFYYVPVLMGMCIIALRGPTGNEY